LRYLKAAIFFILTVVGILFGISNQNSATVHVFWYYSISYPLYLVLFACFLAGTITAILFCFMSGGDLKDDEHHLNKRLEDLKGRLVQAKAAGASLTPPPGGIDGPPGSTP
jgi:uncharacterized integral membrane protein